MRIGGGRLAGFGQRIKVAVVPGISDNHREGIPVTLRLGHDPGKLFIEDEQPFIFYSGVNKHLRLFLLIPFFNRISHGMNDALAA